MRILIVSDAWKPQVNGVARTYQWLSHTLASRVDLSLLTPDGFPSTPLPTYPEIKLALPWPWRIQKTIQSIKPDIVHVATEGSLGFLARRYCKKAGIPFTTCYHTRYPEYLAKRFPFPESCSYAALRRFHNAASRTLVATRELAAELEMHGFRNVVQWKRGIDVRTFAVGAPAVLDIPRPIFLYVGRLAIEKGVDQFLGLDLPGSKVVVGDGPDRSRLQTHFPHAHFLGAQHGAELGAIYRAADCFVFPSRTDTYGLVMIEALASGVPVACYPSSGARDIFAGTGCGIMSEDLKSAALAALLIPREVCRANGTMYTLEASADHFVSILRDVIQDHAIARSRG